MSAKGYVTIGKQFAIRYLLYTSEAIAGYVADNLLIVPLYFNCTQFNVPQVDDLDYRYLVVQVSPSCEMGSFPLGTLECLLGYLRRNLLTNSKSIRLVSYTTDLDFFKKIDGTFKVNLAGYDDSYRTVLDIYYKYFLWSNTSVDSEFGVMEELQETKWNIELEFVYDEVSGAEEYIKRYYRG